MEHFSTHKQEHAGALTAAPPTLLRTVFPCLGSERPAAATWGPLGPSALVFGGVRYPPAKPALKSRLRNHHGNTTQSPRGLKGAGQGTSARSWS